MRYKLGIVKDLRKLKDAELDLYEAQLKKQLLSDMGYLESQAKEALTKIAKRTEQLLDEITQIGEKEHKRIEQERSNRKLRQIKKI